MKAMLKTKMTCLRMRMRARTKVKVGFRASTKTKIKMRARTWAKGKSMKDIGIIMVRAKLYFSLNL